MLPVAVTWTNQFAGRFEEEVQPFQESVDPTLPLAGDMSESSPWAYLQKTYSNMDEAVQCTSETKGPDGHLQVDLPSLAKVHNGAVMPMQVCNMHATLHDMCTWCYVSCLFMQLIAVSLQAGSIPTQGQTSGVNMWSRNVHENAWGDASAASRPAASHDAAQQHPVKQPSGITSAPAQVHFG